MRRVEEFKKLCREENGKVVCHIDGCKIEAKPEEYLQMVVLAESGEISFKNYYLVWYEDKGKWVCYETGV
jgi:hypothetical protein